MARHAYAALMLSMMALISTMLLPGGTCARPAPVQDSVDDDSSLTYVAGLCAATGLVCSTSSEAGSLHTIRELTAADSIKRDMGIVTINDLQHDFFLERQLVKGGQFNLDSNLHDPIPKRAFLTEAAAATLPEVTSANLARLLEAFNVSGNSRTATTMATSAYLCGNPALPGEEKSCPTSLPAMGRFVAAQLGRNVEVLATTGAPDSAPAVKAPVTIVDFATGSVEQGRTIVVCHNVWFPTGLHYCHRVTGTKVVRATLKAADAQSVIKAVGICHVDTSLWLSRHPAFAALNIPRGEEACHWLVSNDLVFVRAADAAKAHDATVVV